MWKPAVSIWRQNLYLPVPSGLIYRVSKHLAILRGNANGARVYYATEGELTELREENADRALTLNEQILVISNGLDTIAQHWMARREERQ